MGQDRSNTSQTWCAPAGKGVHWMADAVSGVLVRRTRGAGMSEIAAATTHEAYAFACMRCGYGWEQAYEIEHHVDGSGNEFVVYTADGVRVPSPLSTPTCTNCGGHVVR